MSSIVTITFSPCIDKTISVPRLVPEVKLKCSSPKLEPGGGGINVARAIKKLGGSATAIYPAGGYTGKFFIELLNKENVSSIIVETLYETRENIIVLDESSNQQYRFGMPCTLLTPTEWPQLLSIFETMKDVGFIVASGSLPAGVPPDIFVRIATIAKKNTAKLIVDTSGAALKHAVHEGVFLIKPNLGELSWLAGKEYLAEDEIIIAARQLIQNNNCEAVVVSMGSAGALLVTKTIEKRIISPRVQRKSTVGAGDSMVAGIVLSLSNGESLETAVTYGVACGTAATLNPGTELCKREDADKIFNLINADMAKHPVQ